jgi:hypothetical protein
VVFKKPKALALYTRVKTTSTIGSQTDGEVKSMLMGLKVTHLLLSKDIEDYVLEKFIITHPSEAALIWQNEKFLLYHFSAKQ